MTSMVDNDSPNFNEAVANGYLVMDGDEVGLIKWWHGTGALLDYSNPAAVQWWHAQQDNVINLGLDGWKVDGTDPFIMELLDPRWMNGSASYRQYADAYYGDCFDYIRYH